MNEFYLTLAVVNFIYVMINVFYAWQIYLAPSPHGWTWISVAVGTLGVIFGMMFNHFILYHYEMLSATNLLLIPAVSLAEAGLPMTIGQIIKKRREDQNTDKVLGRDR